MCIRDRLIGEIAVTPDNDNNASGKLKAESEPVARMEGVGLERDDQREVNGKNSPETRLQEDKTDGSPPESQKHPEISSEMGSICDSPSKQSDEQKSQGIAVEIKKEKPLKEDAVSYTHLTLPTKRIV